MAFAIEWGGAAQRQPVGQLIKVSGNDGDTASRMLYSVQLFDRTDEGRRHAEYHSSNGIDPTAFG
jgi:hypothetical protein